MLWNGKKSLHSQFFFPEVAFFCQKQRYKSNGSIAKNLQFEVMVEAQIELWRSYWAYCVQNEPSVKLICSSDYFFKWQEYANELFKDLPLWFTIKGLLQLHDNYLCNVYFCFTIFLSVPKNPITLVRPSRLSTLDFYFSQACSTLFLRWCGFFIKCFWMSTLV